ncbi:MAG: alpha/beta hydrolase [Anaerolineales bacterium]|nr:alpha/beta hydrolase [Anaerolineales bacterium]
MSKGLKFIFFGIIILFAVVFFALAIVTRSQALDIVNHPLEERPDMEKDPGDYGMVFEVVSVTTEDGLKLYGWYIPGENGGTVMIQHGSPGGRQDGLYEADILNEAGYGVLLGSFRAHDECEGELISFGFHEQKDIAAWHQYLLSRDDLDPDRIGLFGESMGGGTSILYTAENPSIRALATGSGFALTREVVILFLQFETDLPPALIPLLSRFIVFWAERGADFQAESLDTEAVISQISPVPILIIHGGEDDKIGPEVGKQLFAAAAEPKELTWFEKAGHVNFEDFYPEEYNRALINFFDQHLLGN